jgi:sterol desaturase/sphingolipid hydroxylase (fatty acid hydroxylase superfamily)
MNFSVWIYNNVDAVLFILLCFFLIIWGISYLLKYLRETVFESSRIISRNQVEMTKRLDRIIMILEQINSQVKYGK